MKDRWAVWFSLPPYRGAGLYTLGSPIMGLSNMSYLPNNSFRAGEPSKVLRHKLGKIHMALKKAATGNCGINCQESRLTVYRRTPVSLGRGPILEGGRGALFFQFSFSWEILKSDPEVPLRVEI